MKTIVIKEEQKINVNGNFDETIGGNTTSITSGKVIIKGSTINLN